MNLPDSILIVLAIIVAILYFWARRRCGLACSNLRQHAKQLREGGFVSITFALTMAVVLAFAYSSIYFKEPWLFVGAIVALIAGIVADSIVVG